MTLLKKCKDCMSKNSETRTEYEQNIIKRQIEAVENQIDAEVFKIFDLTNDEINLIKNVNKDWAESRY